MNKTNNLSHFEKMGTVGTLEYITIYKYSIFSPYRSLALRTFTALWGILGSFSTSKVPGSYGSQAFLNENNYQLNAPLMVRKKSARKVKNNYGEKI